jgi:drug/metabolite transporter (DMT)-like permease
LRLCRARLFGVNNFSSTDHKERKVSHSDPATSQYRASPLAVWTALGAVYLIWGSTYLAIRFAVETLPPFLSAAARFVISGAFLYFWRRMAGDPAPSKLEWRNTATIGILLLVGGNGGVVWAAQFIPSSLAALLVATAPLWMIMIDALRPGGAWPNFKSALGIVIGFCGAALLIGWSASATEPANFHGAVAVVAASLFWALGSIQGKTAKLPSSPLVATGMEMLVGGAVQIAVAWVFGEFRRFDFNLVSARSAVSWTYLTVIGPVAFVAYAWLLRNAPIPLVATYSYVNPLVAILLGYFFGREIITARTLLAAALVVGSVALVSGAKKT